RRPMSIIHAAAGKDVSAAILLPFELPRTTGSPLHPPGCEAPLAGAAMGGNAGLVVETGTTPELEYIFHPRSIAIAGVSARSNAGFGGLTFVQSLQEIGFEGPIYLIHPTAPAIRGLKCYSSLSEVPDDVDYVISSVRANLVPALLEDC